jgi:hypothetical protein
MAKTRQSAIQLCAAILLTLSAIVVSSPAQAELPSPAMLATLKEGKVEAVGTASIQISGVEYRVNSSAKILDHDGNEMTLEKVFLFSEARFHLSKNGDIDIMVLTRRQ